MRLQALLRGIPYVKRLTKTPTLHAVSCFSPAGIEICFFRQETPSARAVECGRLEAGEAEKTGARAREVLASGGSWVHVVLRQSGFVKTFPVPETPDADFDSVVLRRVREEMPHLADDMIYHVRTQTPAGRGREGLLFGIAKATLEEQLSRLEANGIIPDAVVLSTEVLFRQWAVDYKDPAGTEPALLVHGARDQLELLYVAGDAVLQSRWVKKDAAGSDAAGSAVRTANEAFSREWRMTPKKIFQFDEYPESGSLAGIGAELSRPAASLREAALAAVRAGAVFDFTPEAREEKRTRRRALFEKARLCASLLVCAAACFVLSAAQLAGVAAETVSVHLRRAPADLAVRDLKALRSRALETRSLYEKKAAPLALLAGLRSAVPDGLLASNLEYDEARNAFDLKGEAVSETSIQEYLTALQKEETFERITLERVEADTDERGGRAYQFEIRGFLRGRRLA